VIGGTRDTGAVVLFVLAPHLAVVVEVFDGGLDGHVLRPTRVSVDGHGVGLLLITNGGRARVVRRARARGTRAIIHVMGVVVRPFVGPASVLMATRAVISILPRALLASSASTIVTVSIRAMVVTIGAMVIALTIRTTSSTSSAGGILVRATALLVGAITGVIGGSLLLFLVRKSLDGTVLDIGSKVLREGSTNRVQILPDIFVRVGVLLLIRGREGQDVGLCKLVGIWLRKLGPKQATIEESKESGSAVKCNAGRHRMMPSPRNFCPATSSKKRVTQCSNFL
jgi:hypothetical protein